MMNGRGGTGSGSCIGGGNLAAVPMQRGGMMQRGGRWQQANP